MFRKIAMLDAVFKINQHSLKFVLFDLSVVVAIMLFNFLLLYFPRTVDR